MSPPEAPCDFPLFSRNVSDLGSRFLTWNWSWQHLVLHQTGYHSLCIYVYVLSNPPPVSIVYFFLIV